MSKPITITKLNTSTPLLESVMALPRQNSKKPIESLILSPRGQKVILDADLSDFYGAPTKVFNEAFQRNRQRFLDDFAFQLIAGVRRPGSDDR